MKAGRWTVAASFIFIGLTLIFNQWTDTNLFLQLLPWWPVLLVALGAEIILFYRRKEDPVKVDVIGIALLSVVLIAGGVVTGVQKLMPNFSLDEGTFDIHLGENWEQKKLEPLTIPVDHQTNLKLENDNGRIHVTPHDGKDIIVEPTLFVPKKRKGLADRLTEGDDVTYDKSEQLISLAFHTSGNKRFIFGNRDWQFLQLDIKVPATFSVEVNSDNGEVKVREMDGNIHVETDNGKVEVADLGGEAELKTDNGVIKAVQVKGSIKARSANGLIHIDDAGQNVHAQTDNGKIFIRTSQLAGDWEARTALGEIEVAFPETSNAFVEAKTDLGTISSDYPLSQDNDEVVGGTSSGKIGDGKHRVRLKTDAGRIKIKTDSR